MKMHTKLELLAWVEQHQPVTRERRLGAFEDMDYEQLQRWQILEAASSSLKIQGGPVTFSRSHDLTSSSERELVKGTVPAIRIPL